MLQFLSNAFNDPSDPWYYVIGVIFLLLVFGAVAAYVIINGKRKGQGDAEEPSKQVNDEKEKVLSHDESTESAEAPQQQDKE